MWIINFNYLKLKNIIILIKLYLTNLNKFKI